MSDLRVTSTGKAFYQIDSAVAALLLEAFPASFEKIEPKPVHNVQPPSNPAGPRWVARKHPFTGAPELVRVVFNQEQRYPGPNCLQPTVAGAQEAFTSCGHPVPDDVLKQFAVLLQITATDTPDNAAEAHQRAVNEQYVQRQAENAAEAKLRVLGQG